MTISLNRRGVDDHSSIVKVLAKLASHQVSLDLSPLYSPVEEGSKKAKIGYKKVTLVGHSFTENIYTAENKKLFQNQPETSQKSIDNVDLLAKHNLNTQVKTKPSTPAASPKKPEASPMKNVAVPSAEKITKLPTPAAKNNLSVTSPQTLSTSSTTRKLAASLTVSSNNKPQYQQVNTNNLMVHQTHSTFLKSRQGFSQQLSEIIQLQIACAENLFGK